MHTFASFETFVPFVKDVLKKDEIMSVKKVTPLLFVEEIEPCLSFWEKVGFTRGPEVPHGDKLGFVILQKDDVEIMYQTRASVAADIPPLASSPGRCNRHAISTSSVTASASVFIRATAVMS